ncbi:MAG: hypothetical protein KDK54_09385 [Leptospiraceae bacterium]|nr:hypothetical protein [Leptospiraceae bacterium]
MGKIKLIILLLIPVFSVVSQDSGSEGTKFNLTGSMRLRAFDLARDIPVSRSNNSNFVYDIPAEYKARTVEANEKIYSDLELAMQGKKPTRSPKNEHLNYMDTRILMNLEFISSKYFDGVVGVQIGDIPFGGRALSTSGSNADLVSSYDNGAGSGGEMFQTSPINMQTNLLYLNFRLRQYDFFSRYGLQLFSSPQGRVLFTRAPGIYMNKDFKDDKISFEWGWIRARERSIADLDGNGYNDKYGQNSNVFFGKIKYSQINNFKTEIYTYVSKDNDATDANNETGQLYWHGMFNELTLKDFNIIVHGIYNHGVVHTSNSLVNSSQSTVIQRNNDYKIGGALGDIQLTYFYDNSINFNLIGIGTTGRPGTDSDGTSANLKGQGYRPLAPLYAISNLLVDFTGGYALFSASNMTGLIEYGGFTNYVVGPVQLTFGYYQLHASKAPRLGVNREFNSLFLQNSSTYFGDEYNFNLTWSVYSDFKLNFRSGIFFPSDGYRALRDFMGGSFAREAFLSGEYKF